MGLVDLITAITCFHANKKCFKVVFTIVINIMTLYTNFSVILVYSSLFPTSV